MKMLVTGARGNLGKRIVKFSNQEVIEVGREEWGNIDNSFTQKIDVVIHAAYDLKNKIDSDPDRVVDSNILCTSKILKLVKKYKIPKIIFISSCAVYGNSNDTWEESPCFPISINGVTKLLNEKIIAEYCQKYNIKYELLRVFNLYGGDDNFSVVNYLRKAFDGQGSFVLNNGGLSQRDFIHVDDVAKIIINIAQIKHSFNIINVGTGRATSISELVNLVSQKKEIEIKKCSHYESEYSRANISRLLSLMDYKFINICDDLKKHW